MALANAVAEPIKASSVAAEAKRIKAVIFISVTPDRLGCVEIFDKNRASGYAKSARSSNGRGRDEDFSSPPRTDPGVRC
jgi:hypothetical protein